MVRRGITVEQARKIRAEKGLTETRLQRIRMKRGLSQTELAKLSGVTVRMIRAYEQKTRSIDCAMLDTLCSLSKTLGCKIEDILESKELISKYKSVK